MQVGHGIATLVNGAATVTHPKITAECRVLVTRVTGIGTIADLKVSAISPKSGFTITSANVLDNSEVYWVAVA